jgi:hypothetical protein
MSKQNPPLKQKINGFIGRRCGENHDRAKQRGEDTHDYLCADAQASLSDPLSGNSVPISPTLGT